MSRAGVIFITWAIAGHGMNRFEFSATLNCKCRVRRLAAAAARGRWQSSIVTDIIHSNILVADCSGRMIGLSAIKEGHPP